MAPLIKLDTSSVGLELRFSFVWRLVFHQTASKLNVVSLELRLRFVWHPELRLRFVWVFQPHKDRFRLKVGWHELTFRFAWLFEHGFRFVWHGEPHQMQSQLRIAQHELGFRLVWHARLPATGQGMSLARGSTGGAEDCLSMGDISWTLAGNVRSSEGWVRDIPWTLAAAKGEHGDTPRAPVKRIS